MGQQNRSHRLPYWYGIEPILFIYHGDWSDPEVSYNGMVVNSYTVEDSMTQLYREHCEEHQISDDNYDGFEEYMRENADEVKELIEIAYQSLQEQIEQDATLSYTICDTHEIKIRPCDVKKILKDYCSYLFDITIRDIVSEPYIMKQFVNISTESLIEAAEFLRDVVCISREEAICEIVTMIAQEYASTVKNN